MAEYYTENGRYFGEDTSFYEFDGDCLRQKGELQSMDENFDRLFTNRKLDMLKTAIPYLPYRQQKSFACAVKLLEFQNLLRYFGKDRASVLSACSDGDPGMRMADMLEALRAYCTPAEQEQIDSLSQVLTAMVMMREGQEEQSI